MRTRLNEQMEIPLQHTVTAPYNTVSCHTGHVRQLVNGSKVDAIMEQKTMFKAGLFSVWYHRSKYEQWAVPSQIDPCNTPSKEILTWPPLLSTTTALDAEHELSHRHETQPYMAIVPILVLVARYNESRIVRAIIIRVQHPNRNKIPKNDLLTQKDCGGFTTSGGMTAKFPSWILRITEHDFRLEQAKVPHEQIRLCSMQAIVKRLLQFSSHLCIIDQFFSCMFQSFSGDAKSIGITFLGTGLGSVQPFFSRRLCWDLHDYGVHLSIPQHKVILSRLA